MWINNHNYGVTAYNKKTQVASIWLGRMIAGGGFKIKTSILSSLLLLLQIPSANIIIHDFPLSYVYGTL